jgi:hypothetical protein
MGRPEGKNGRALARHPSPPVHRRRIARPIPRPEASGAHPAREKTSFGENTSHYDLYVKAEPTNNGV